MATTTASRKAKGRHCQQEIVKAILATFQGVLTENDVRSTPMGTQGDDVWLSEKALSILPLSIEAKAQEKLNIWGAIKQVFDRTPMEEGVYKHIPTVIFKRNRSDIYCCLPLTDLLILFKKLNYRETTNE
jgi:hypothetical protein